MSLEEAVAALEAKVRTAREAYEGARAELEAKREAIASANKELKGLIARRDAAAKGASKADMDARKLEHKVARMQRERAAAEKTVEEMQAAHSWIEAEKQFFGKAHTDYDFAARKPEQAARRLKQLRGQLATLAKSLNKKVIGMIETAEKEYKDLMSKKRIIENDKAEIEVRVVATSGWLAGRCPSPLLTLGVLAARDRGARREEERGAADDMEEGEPRLWVHLQHPPAWHHGQAGASSGRHGPRWARGARGVQRGVEGELDRAERRPALAVGPEPHPLLAALQASTHVRTSKQHCGFCGGLVVMRQDWKV